MTDGTADSPGQATRRGQRDNGSPNPAETREYSERLAALARFTLRHKALVIGVWLGAAVVLALLFPQLETVVRQQSVDLIPRDAPSLQTVDRMSAAFGEEGSKTMVFVAMEDPNGLTPTARQRYGELVSRLQTEGDHVLLVQDLLADPITEAQAVSVDRKAWYLPVGVAGTLGDPTAAESVNAVRDIIGENATGTDVGVYFLKGAKDKQRDWKADCLLDARNDDTKDVTDPSKHSADIVSLSQRRRPKFGCAQHQKRNRFASCLQPIRKFSNGKMCTNSAPSARFCNAKRCTDSSESFAHNRRLMQRTIGKQDPC